MDETMRIEVEAANDAEAEARQCERDHECFECHEELTDDQFEESMDEYHIPLCEEHVVFSMASRWRP